MVKLLLPTNCLSVFDHFVRLAFKACFRYFYQIFIFSPNDSPSKTMKNVFLFRIKSSFCSHDIQFFVNFLVPFHTFRTLKDKWN